jgi:hypothetical protein
VPAWQPVAPHTNREQKPDALPGVEASGGILVDVIPSATATRRGGRPLAKRSRPAGDIEAMHEVSEGADL